MMNKPPNNTGFKRLINAGKFSIKGLCATFNTEAAFRQECYASLILIPLSFFIATTLVEWLLLIITLGFVFVIEIINSAIEAAIDRFGGEIHELSGKAKDAGSAAVFIAIFITIITWLTILFS